MSFFLSFGPRVVWLKYAPAAPGVYSIKRFLLTRAVSYLFATRPSYLSYYMHEARLYFFCVDV